MVMNATTYACWGQKTTSSTRPHLLLYSSQGGLLFTTVHAKLVCLWASRHFPGENSRMCYRVWLLTGIQGVQTAVMLVWPVFPPQNCLLVSCVLLLLLLSLLVLFLFLLFIFKNALKIFSCLSSFFPFPQLINFVISVTSHWTTRPKDQFWATANNSKRTFFILFLSQVFLLPSLLEELLYIEQNTISNYLLKL